MIEKIEMCMYRKVLAPDVDVLVFVEMDRLLNPVEEAIEGVNPKEQGLLASNP